MDNPDLLHTHLWSEGNRREFKQDGKTISLRRCSSCGRDFAQGLNGDGWHAVHVRVSFGRTFVLGRDRALERTYSTAAESKHGGTLDDHVAELAHHYARSANTSQAMKFLHLAGEQASACFAMVEAERHYITALKLLDELPETPERDRRELALQLSVGPALMAVKGWAAPEVERAYTRGRKLGEQLGELAQYRCRRW